VRLLINLNVRNWNGHLEHTDTRQWLLDKVTKWYVSVCRTAKKTGNKFCSKFSYFETNYMVKPSFKCKHFLKKKHLQSFADLWPTLMGFSIYI